MVCKIKLPYFSGSTHYEYRDNDQNMRISFIALSYTTNCASFSILYSASL